MSTSDFWNPSFDYEHRAVGTIIMCQRGELPDGLPTLADFLDKWADATPDKTWLARRENGGEWRRVTYAQARDHARAIGGSLLSLGLGPNRPLMILSENSLEHALLGIACTYVGIPFAPVSPAYSLVSQDHAKLKGIAKALNPAAIYADDGATFGPAINAIAADDRAVITLTNPVLGTIPFDDLAMGDVTLSAAHREALTPETVVKFLFTSGSTGAPKAVINTNKMICASQMMIRDCYRFLNDAPPIVLDWAPWNHTAGGNKVFYLVMTNGGTLYIDDGRPTPDKFDETLRNLREISCSWYFNVPVGYDKLVDELEQDEALSATFFATLRMMFYAGAGMAQRTWDRLRAMSRKAAGHEVLLATGLGATETAPFAFACTQPQDKSGNIGVPSLGLSLKLVPNNGKLEARLKGPSITLGYYCDPVKTAEAFDDEGYYKLGDALRPADPKDFSKGFFFDGRIAENFKLNTGTWVAVGALRAKLVDQLGGLIRDAVIVGEDKPALGALLLLSPKGEALEAEALKSALQDYLSAAAKDATGSASRIRHALILTGNPSFDKGEVTEKGSLNQRAMRANNTDLIEALYLGGTGIFSV